MLTIFLSWTVLVFYECELSSADQPPPCELPGGGRTELAGEYRGHGLGLCIL